MRFLIVLLLFGVMLAGCTQGDGGPDAPGGSDGPSGELGDGAAEARAWVAARFDDGMVHTPLFLNGTIAQGDASGCTISYEDDAVCVGDEARLDLTPHVEHGFAYAFTATLTHSPPDDVGATNVGYQSSEPWGDAEWDRDGGTEAVAGRFVRLTDEPLFLSVYHLLPAEHDITFSLRVQLEPLQHPLAASVPIALDVDRSVTEVAVPLVDDGVVRAWDGADTYLGRFAGNESVTTPAGDAVVVARINVSAADRSAPLVLQVIGAADDADAPPVLVRGPDGPGAPSLRFLATETAYVPHTAMAGPVEASWEFTPTVVPLRVGAYMGAPDRIEAWSADGVHMVLSGPGDETLAEISSGCTFCGGGVVMVWSAWNDDGVEPGTYTVTVDAADPYPQAIGAGGEVGHVVVTYQR